MREREEGSILRSDIVYEGGSTIEATWSLNPSSRLR